MKELGHAYVAEKVTGTTDNLLYIGCLIPDLVWYTRARPALEKANLHDEGAVTLHDFIKKNNPSLRPLSVAILSHGTLFGAYCYNDKSYKGGKGFAYRYSQSLEKEVAICCNISATVAKIRAHNFIELMDLLIAKRETELVNRIEKSIQN